MLTDLSAADDFFDYNVTTTSTLTFSPGTIAPTNNVQLFYKVLIK